MADRYSFSLTTFSPRYVLVFNMSMYPVVFEVRLMLTEAEGDQTFGYSVEQY